MSESINESNNVVPNVFSLPITWATRGQGEANDKVIFTLVNAPVSASGFPSWLLEQAANNVAVKAAIYDAVVLALKPACQRIAKESLNRTLTADFGLIWDAFINGSPVVRKYLETSEATALAEVLMAYWQGKESVRETATALLIGALTNKAPKGANPLALLKVREAWTGRLTLAGVEVPPALVYVAPTAIDDDAY